MNSLKNFAFLLMHLIMNTNGSVKEIISITELGMDQMGVDDVGVKHVGEDQVSQLVAHLVEQHYTGCHLVLLTTAPDSLAFSSIRKHVQMNEGTVVASDFVGYESLQKVLARGFTATCKVLVLHVSNNNWNRTVITLRLLDRAGLWKLPETRVVVVGGQVGGRAWVKTVLLHRSFRNTVHGLYLSLYRRPTAISTLGKDTARRPPSDGSSIELGSRRVSVYRRCVFCSGGKAGVHFLYHLQLDFVQRGKNLRHIPLSSDSLENFLGHNFRVTTIPYFPFTAYSRDTPERGTTVTLKDSLNVRILHTFADALNFTFEVRETVDRSFGNIGAEGEFTGLVGDLQREEADFCLLLAPTWRRLQVLDYLRLEPVAPFVIVSRKPTLLPAIVSIISPFSGALWAGLLMGLLVWSVTAWGLQRLWVLAAGGPAVTVSKTLLYGWGALLAKPPADPSISFSGQMLVGWWLMFCLVISMGYTSSLIAHLTVKAKSLVPEGFNDLVAFDDWRWGIEKWMLDGELLDYFQKSPETVVQTVYRKMEVLGLNDLLKKVVDERFSLVSIKDYITVIVESSYSDEYGQIPFYMSRDGPTVIACFGWGVRKGSPFLGAFKRIASRLENAGLVQQWTEEVLSQKIKENKAKTVSGAAKVFSSQEDKNEVVLSLDHLQGAFYLVFLGSGLATFTLLAEKIVRQT